MVDVNPLEIMVSICFNGSVGPENTVFFFLNGAFMCMCCVDFLEFSIMDGLRSLITVTTDGGSTWWVNYWWLTLDPHRFQRSARTRSNKIRYIPVVS